MCEERERGGEREKKMKRGEMDREKEKCEHDNILHFFFRKRMGSTYCKPQIDRAHMK